MRAEALAVNEDLVLRVARKKGICFETALGQLLFKKTLSKSAFNVKCLNFTSPEMRGADLKRSLLYMGKFSKNEFNFKCNLRALVGAKDNYNLERKITEFEFTNPALLICAIGTQFSRLEMRYILKGIDFREAYARKLDQFFTLQAITHDIYEFGIDQHIMSYLHQFTSEIVNPNFDLNCINENNTTYFEKSKSVSNSSNNNNNKNEMNLNSVDNDTNNLSNFTYDGSEINYNMNEELGCTIKLTTPMFDLYSKLRQHFGKSTTKDTIYKKFSRGEKIEYCSNGACWLFNLGCDACPYCNGCVSGYKDKKTEAHLHSHYCALCEGPHPIILCVFIRSFMVIVKCTDANWFSKTYDLAQKRIFNPNHRSKSKFIKYHNNQNNNSNNNPSVGFNFGSSNSNSKVFGAQHGGYGPSPQTHLPYSQSVVKSEFGAYDSGYNNYNNGYNSNNNNNTTPHYGSRGNNRGSRRGGYKGKGGGNYHNNNNYDNANHNGGS